MDKCTRGQFQRDLMLRNITQACDKAERKLCAEMVVYNEAQWISTINSHSIKKTMIDITYHPVLSRMLSIPREHKAVLDASQTISEFTEQTTSTPKESPPCSQRAVAVAAQTLCPLSVRLKRLQRGNTYHFPLNHVAENETKLLSEAFSEIEPLTPPVERQIRSYDSAPPSPTSDCSSPSPSPDGSPDQRRLSSPQSPNINKEEHSSSTIAIPRSVLRAIKRRSRMEANDLSINSPSPPSSMKPHARFDKTVTAKDGDSRKTSLLETPSTPVIPRSTRASIQSIPLHRLSTSAGMRHSRYGHRRISQKAGSDDISTCQSSQRASLANNSATPLLASRALRHIHSSSNTVSERPVRLRRGRGGLDAQELVKIERLLSREPFWRHSRVFQGWRLIQDDDNREVADWLQLLKRRVKRAQEKEISDFVDELNMKYDPLKLEKPSGDKLLQIAAALLDKMDRQKEFNRTERSQHGSPAVPVKVAAEPNSRNKTSRQNYDKGGANAILPSQSRNAIQHIMAESALPFARLQEEEVLDLLLRNDLDDDVSLDKGRAQVLNKQQRLADQMTVCMQTAESRAGNCLKFFSPEAVKRNILVAERLALGVTKERIQADNNTRE